MGLPDFLLIGAPKAATTALHVALARHPGLALSKVKEPKYFLTDGPPPTGGGPGDAKTYSEYVWRREDYEQLWEGAKAGQLKGESTSLYLQDPAAHRRIRAAIPEAKLIAVLRDPVDRAHSNWSHLRSAGLETVADFPSACMLGADRIAAGWGPFWGYIEVGRYGGQIEHLLNIFPREQLLLLSYRQVRETPVETLDAVCGFLGVETGLVGEIPVENVTAHVSDGLLNRGLHRVVQSLDGRHSGSGAGLRAALSRGTTRLLQREQQIRPTLAIEERRLLMPHFSADIDTLERVTGQSFSHWRDPRNASVRRVLETDRRFGTAFSSIDNPLQNDRMS